MPGILDHAKAVVTGGDADRLAGRREVRKKLAPLIASQQRFAAIRDQLVAIDQRESKAVAGHEKTTDPLQSAMLQIESDVTDSILKDEPIGEKIAKKRTALLDKIATANSKLEAEVDVLRKLRSRYQLDLGGESGVDREIQNLRNKLRGKLGSPKLLAKRFVNQHAFKCAHSRLLAAEDGLRDADSDAETAAAAREKRGDDELPSDYELQVQRELGYWTAERDEAAAIKDAVLEEKQRLKDRLEEE